MFKWLKDKGMSAVRRTCQLNIKLNTKTMISVANRVEKEMMENGGNYDNSDMMEIMKAAQALFADVRLGVSNGISMEDIENNIIRPILNEEETNSFTKGIMEDALVKIRKELE